MAMVSYAQNGEDVMLMRALAGVTEGFYVDAGAADPTADSVTRAFYDRGWHGVNVEPSSEHHAALARERPRDVNLLLALDAVEGRATFHQIDGSGLSTIEGDLARQHGGEGWAVTSAEIETSTLARVCERYAPSEIHFLKVDVEGAEERVLRGADFGRYRPWIVLVEATRPLTQEPSYADWEPLLEAAGYEFAWFDGLNRFYLAVERAEALRPHFQVPLNLFDDIARHDPEHDRLRARAASAELHAGQAQAAEARAAEAERASARRGVEAEASEARARDAHARTALAEARAEAAEVLARAAAIDAEAAAAHAAAAQARLGDLKHDIDETRRRHDELLARERSVQALLSAREAEHEARLALLRRDLDAKVTAHDRLLSEAGLLAARVGELEVELRALTPEPPLPAEVPAVLEELAVESPALVVAPRRGAAARLYGATLRPLMRPLAWRSRSFLLDGVRAALEERDAELLRQQERTFAELRARGDKAVDLLHRAEADRGQLAEGMNRVRERMDAQDAGRREDFTELRTRADKVVDLSHRIETALGRGPAVASFASSPAGPAPDLSGLAASMEAALMTLAVAGRRRED